MRTSRFASAIRDVHSGWSLVLWATYHPVILMRLFCLGFLLSGGATLALAQTPANIENGFKPYGSYDGTNLDTINVMNGNLMLHVPMPWTYPQRGSDINPHNLLTVTSKTWHEQCNSNNNAPPTCYWTNGWGLQQVLALTGTGLGFDHTMDMALHRVWQSESGPGGNGPTSYSSFGYYLDTADGSTHQLWSSPNGPFDPNGDPLALESIDTTGFHVALTNVGSDGTPSGAVVTDRHGNQYLMGKWAGTCTHSTSNGNGGNITTVTCTQVATIASITDVNGNAYTVWNGSGSEDTMGRPFLSSSSSAPASNSAAEQCVGGGLTVTSATTFTYPGPGGVTNQITACYATLDISTAFGVSGILEAQNAPGAPQPLTAQVLVTLVMADGTKWTFSYDSYMDVTQVGLPLGGSISYTWTTVSTSSSCGANKSRAVTSRTLSDNNGHVFTWNYSWGTPGNTSLTNTVTDPLGNDTAHVFSALDVNSQGVGCTFYETSTQYYQGTGSGRQLLKQIDTTYSSAILLDQSGGGADLGNVVATSIKTTVYPSGEVSLVTKSYDSGLGTNAPIFGDVTQELDYDWGQGSPGALLREVDTTYEWQVNSAYLGAQLLDLPASVVTKDGNGNRVAETDYTYDESQFLTASSISTQHGAAPNSVRGNMTTVSKWLNTSANPVMSHSNWYDTGELYQAIDPLGNTITHTYSSSFAGAYPTQTCNALSQCVSGNYDFNTGLLTSFTDANGNTSNYSYDFLSRLTTAQSPADPSGNHPQTTLTYSAPNSFPFNVQRQKTITTSLSDISTTYFDGLGRPYEIQHATPNGNATVITTYDALDHPISVTNPYFSTSDPTYGVTQTQYDALGRATQVTKQDGSISSVAYEVSVPSGVTGDCTVSTDEAGNPRRTCVDGMGRLIEVDEPGDSIANFNGAAAPATAVYAMTGFSDSYGEHDLYVGTDQHIYQLYQTGYGWVNQDLTALTGGGLAASHSGMTNFSDGNGNHIVYVGANQHVYQMLFSGSSGWQNQDLSALTGNTLAVTTAGLSSFVDSYGSHVLYIGNNQHVYQLYWSGSWQNQDLSAQTGNNLALATTGFTTFTDSYGEHAVYEGANQHVYQLYFANGWVNQDLTSMTGNTQAASPTAFSSLTDSYGVHVFYFASNQHLDQLYFSGGWQNQDLSAMTGNTLAANGSSLSSFADYMGEHVFYVGTNQHLYQMFFSGSSGWSNNDLTAMTSSPGATNGGGSAAYSDSSGEHVFYDGGGQGVYELSWDGGAWRFSNVGGPSLAENYYITQYSYDALGNLLTAMQKGDPSVNNSSQYRARTFSYDSLSRLLTTTNPESGQISYSYDANGNVLQKTSPAPNQTGSSTQTISYCYDKLNRVIGKAYTAQSCPLSSPVVTYSYDSGTNGIGHLTGLTDQAGSGSYSYDALGRFTSEQRTIAGIQKSLSYTYNLDSSMASLTYPSGAVVTYTPDSAGRVLSAVDTGNNINYVTQATYGPDSSLTGFISGNSSSFAGITNSWQYNPRLQICRITALTTGSVPTSCTDSSHTGNVLDLGYNLNLGAGDNGNVIGITNYKDTTRSQSFSYDALNRLTSAQNSGTNCNPTTVNGKTEYWGNSYGYDPWGNLQQKTVAKCSAESLSVTALSNNQLSGYGYDAAGNMSHDTTTNLNYTFDAENRITGAAGYTYTYDADGNRVEKSNGSTGTIYWYMSPGIVAESDLSGNLKSEYVFFDGERVARKDFSGNTTSVAYYFSDHLKTASAITNSAGVITEDEDYYPWGGELQFVSSDSNHYKFTGKERDSETGLDYFGARYYGNWLGRFLSADWSSKPVPVPYADLTDPQTLNLYGYVRGLPNRQGRS